MLGFLIVIITSYEACRGMGNSPDPHNSTKGKEQGKRHAKSTYSFSSCLQKMAVFERSAGLYMGRQGICLYMGQCWISVESGRSFQFSGLWPPCRAMKVGIR